jgi:hypothetical protein
MTETVALLSATYLARSHGERTVSAWSRRHAWLARRVTQIR